MCFRILEKASKNLNIFSFVPFSSLPIWIGLNDIEQKGSWQWIRSYPSNYGETATKETILWETNQPYSLRSYNCGGVLYYRSFFTASFNCGATFYFFCEKSV